MCTRCDELQEEVRQLRALLAPPTFNIPTSWGLTRGEQAVFLALLNAKGRVLTYEYLFEASRGRDRNVEVCDPENNVSVRIVYVRKKLRKAGAPYKIVTAWGRGYCLQDLQ